ncbi:MAG: class I SAM-dependent methyltransferase [Treponema sp.]|nr:class I SAM-dependent methyltransferase [Treponema sp.]
MNTTIQYYNKNATSFTTDTLTADMTFLQDKFISYLPANSFVLDFGCGSGRDTKYFLSKNLKVKAIDGSEKMCEIAHKNTGIEIEHVLFSDFECEENCFDGVWACASILHLPPTDLPIVLKKLELALKSNGILYASFKYGENDRIVDGRFFTDMTEKRFSQFFNSFKNNYRIIETLVTPDVRKNRENEKWLNVFLRKN